MKVTLDSHGCMYIHLIEGIEAVKTEELVKDQVLIDKTCAGQIAGIEVLNVELDKGETCI